MYSPVVSPAFFALDTTRFFSAGVINTGTRSVAAAIVIPQLWVCDGHVHSMAKEFRLFNSAMVANAPEKLGRSRNNHGA